LYHTEKGIIAKKLSVKTTQVQTMQTEYAVNIY